MKAVMLSLFVVLANPDISVIMQTYFPTREVCEIEEGRLNKEITDHFFDDITTADFNGIKLMFVKAQCEDYELPAKENDI